MTEILIARLPKNRRSEIRIAISFFKEVPAIDVRLWACRRADGLWVPSKKGASLPVEHLPSLLAALNMAARKAHTLGLLPNLAGLRLLPSEPEGSA